MADSEDFELMMGKLGCMGRQSVANSRTYDTFLFMGISRQLSILASFHKQPKNCNYREEKNKQDE
jgi:hypothetical protein